MGVELDTLEIKVEHSAGQASAGIDKLTASLQSLKEVVKGTSGLQRVANQISSLNKALSGINAKGVSSLHHLGKGLKYLYGLENVKISSSIGSQIGAIADASVKIDASFDGKMQSLANGLAPLSQLGKANMTSFINQLGKLPAVIEKLKEANLDTFANQMKQVAAAMKPLADEMQKVSNGFAAFPIRIQKIIQSNAGLAASNTSVGVSFTRLGGFSLSALGKMTMFGVAARQVVQWLSDCVTSINEYVENVNLFQVSMGEFYPEAYDYAQLVSSKLGVDPSEWMRTQGVFMSMAKGFGLAERQAYELSEGLTELTYDIGSLYNEDFATAAQRLQSALAGEIEPIRRLGISISQATLQEYAMSKGITENVSAMTEQEKALLRSLKLMEGAYRIGAVGDLAKTLESPANALRILNQQITQFKRAIGSVMLPAIMGVLPFIQAVVTLLTEWIQRLAVLVGFTMPEWDDADWTRRAGGVTAAVDETTSALKKLKNVTLGIDELNILSSVTGGANEGDDGVSDWATGLEIPEVWDKAALDQIKTKADEIKEKLEPVLKTALEIGAAFLLWRIGNALLGGLTTLWMRLDSILARASLIGGAFWFIYNAAQAWNDRLDLSRLNGMLQGLILFALGVYALMGPLAGVLTLVAGGIAFVAIGFRDWLKNGTTAENVMALSFGVALIAGALMLVNVKLGLVVAGVGLVAVAFITHADVICGALNVVVQFIQNVINYAIKLQDAFFAVLSNVGIFIGNAFVRIFGAWKALCHNIGAFFENTITNLLIGWKSFVIGVNQGALKISQTINNLFGAFGIEINTSGMEKNIRRLAEEKKALEGSKIEYMDIGEAFANAKERKAYVDVEAAFGATNAFEDGWLDSAWEAGSKFGAGLQEQIKETFSPFFGIGEGDTTWPPRSSFSTDGLLSEFQSVGEKYSAGFGEANKELSGIAELTRADTETSVQQFTQQTDWLGTMTDDWSALEKSLNADTLKDMRTSTNSIQSAISSAASRIVASTDRIRINVIRNVLSPLGAFASGGFPTSGQLFLASEAGPELVGSIGGRSAVANNSQIVAGIASGVRDANTEQNALLRRQNELLLAILEKDTGFVLDGKTLRRSVEKAARESGAGIMTGGVRG